MAEKRCEAQVLVKDCGISLNRALSALGLSKAAYYYRPRAVKDRRTRALDDGLVSDLKELRGYDTVYGYRKVTALLDGYNHKKVYRHMKALNILQPRRLKKRRTLRLDISCPLESNVRWEGDLTYVYDGRNTNYLFVVVDTHDKEPVGDFYGLRCRSEEAIESLEKAVLNRFGTLEPSNGYRVTLRVDQGSQYISDKFRKRAKEMGVKLEYCGISCPDDKPYIESFFSRYKCEEVYRNEYGGHADALRGWYSYKQWYANRRIHQGLGFMTIPEFKTAQSNRLLLAQSDRSENTGA